VKNQNTKVSKNKILHHINHKIENIFFLYVFFITLNKLIDRISSEITISIHKNTATNICKNSIA
jgi:hypothetical protein